ncbi:MAG: Flp pilus assembly protein CpaB [Bacillota bacterium]|nr:Flp pilus assembly protein CpaB [Bacillota bacterium]
MKKIYLFATIFAILTGLAVYNFASKLEKHTADGEITAVAAAKDIPENTQITSDMLKLVPIQKEAAGKAAVDISKVTGKITRYPLVSGEYIIPDKLGDKTGGSNSQLSYTLEQGQRAISLGVDDITGISGYIKKGDHVDVLASYLKNSIQTTAILVQNAKVIALSTANAEEGTKGYKSVTLAVSTSDSLKIDYALTYGKIMLVLRAPLDSSNVSETTFTP